MCSGRRYPADPPTVDEVVAVMRQAGRGPIAPHASSCVTLRSRRAVQRMDVGIVVDDLPATIDFFRKLGLELEGQGTVEGEWAGRVTGLGDQRVEIAMMRTPDGHSRLELSRFLMPPTVADYRNAR